MLAASCASCAALVAGPPALHLRRTRGSRAAGVECALTSEQREVLIEASTNDPFCSTGETPLTQATPATWAQVRARWPVLSAATDEELKDAYDEYLKEPPSLLGVLTKTPLGPFLLLWGVPWQELLGDQQLLGTDLGVGWTPFGGS